MHRHTRHDVVVCFLRQRTGEVVVLNDLELVETLTVFLAQTIEHWFGSIDGGYVGIRGLPENPLKLDTTTAPKVQNSYCVLSG